MTPLLALALGAAAAGDLDVPGFGHVAVLAPRGPPARVVLLLADDERGARALASALTERGALVATVRASTYLASRPRERCAYPAGDLEELAQRVQKHAGLDAYRRPVIAGHSFPGATLAWAAAAQAPEGTFAGAVLVAPCASRRLPVRLCSGAGRAPGRRTGGELPGEGPAAAPPAIVGGPGACPAAEAEELARALGARVTPTQGGLPGVAAALGEAVARIAPVGGGTEGEPAAGAARVAPAVADLPVVEVPAATGGTHLALVLTGDGGWVGVDRALARSLSEAGVAVVGLDSLRYFWKRRTPEETARDVARILAHYRAAWGREEVLLVGYSRGADLVPFVAVRLPAEERARLRLVAMLGPGTFAEFEVHAIDLFSSVKRASALPTEPAVRAAAAEVRLLCVQGADERDSVCPRVAEVPGVRRVVLPGGHHFDHDYAGLARLVLEAAR